MQKVCVMGLGYIGLPLASILANDGYQVLGVDIREDIITKINNGEACSKEPDLKTLVQAAIKAGNLKVSSTKPSKSNIFIIAVQTPLTKAKTADLNYVTRATESILPVLEKGNTVILESTVPPRTFIDVIAPILGKTVFKVGDDIYLAYAPERVLPGAILKELIENDRR